MRRYDDPVDVRRGEVEAPEQFMWRGRLWKVREVVAHWVETGPWWQSDGVHAVLGSDDPSTTTLGPTTGPATGPATGSATGSATGPATGPATDLLAERELWRVAAGMGAGGSPGVFDLAFDWSDGSWQLVGCVD